MRAEGPTAQYGLSFDDRGRKFVCSNSRHIIAEMYAPQYSGINPRYNMPPALVDIAADGAAAEVFRISGDEPWRIIRTRWRIAGVVKGMVEGGGRVSGYFTGATGLTIYRGNAYGAEFANNAFIGDAGGNLVHRKVITENGVELVAQRPADEQKLEFVASRDNWFRPVHFANAPDGCLYIIDMYRETIEHPWSIPESIKQHLDLNSGNDRGRIYRIARDGFSHPAPPRLGNAPTAELVETLAHPNGWHRDTAARLLYQHQDKSAVPLLERLLRDNRKSRGHMQALYVLDSLGSLTPKHLLAAMSDPDAATRQHVLALAEEFSKADGADAQALLEKLATLAGDKDAWVRYQAALSLAVLPVKSKTTALAALADQTTNAWMQAAVLNASSANAASLFTKLLDLGRAQDFSPARAAFLEDLARLWGATSRSNDVQGFVDAMQRVAEGPVMFGFTTAYMDGARRYKTLNIEDANSPLKRLTARANDVALDPRASHAERIPAIELVAWAGDPRAEGLLELIGGREPPELQLAVIKALTQSSNTGWAPGLIARWPQVPQSVRDEAVQLMLARPGYAVHLLEARKQGKIDVNISAAQVALLRAHREKKFRDLIASMFPESGESRAAVIDRFQPAMGLPGDPNKGQEIYRTRCIACHRSGKEGFPVGPDLVTMKTMGREKLLTNILDPNREVAPQFIAYNVERKDGESVMGVIVNETGTSVTLRMPSGLETTLQRAEIAGMTSQGKSMMPEGLEAGMLPQHMADLLSFIESQSSP